ncbi:hypothetical protein [Methylobacterium oxalidis]|uniref:Uncharacterized protein n=1 Tax=Methylobacterium oxalidis TaxID=944322 RepID=A0A512J282_9HYPH|nr:hypothetical protein [Methylobacterium oxalidis]GEP04023.1 hypothetical protein MOX02_20610 [Methylobacterium oxalidis]GJE34853.1 hypothetical protein LDDCCGHA_5068 [Methylobacterium oxalidis]GLS64054.1 hypothetical protein GCM10007888_24350 [Methylobacterium oxalidis]
MPAFLNTLRSVPRRGQWRFRQILRGRRADGRVDVTDAGLIDFSTVSAAMLTVTPRRPRWWDLGLCAGQACEPAPVLTASYPNGILALATLGIVEAVFPDGWARCIPPGLYDVRIAVTIGPETAEIFDEPVRLV